MNKTVITFDLSEEEIDRAIKEVETFRDDFRVKVDTYRKRIAEEIAVNASIGFGSAIMDDIVGEVVGGQKAMGGSPRSPEVEVDFSHDGDISVVIAMGEDAVWCEFGAGVYHNGSVGSSPNPYGSKNGFTIGSYGQGRGKQQVWGYWADESKTKAIITRGTPATMPMYNAVQEVLSKSIAIAREVFG